MPNTDGIGMQCGANSATVVGDESFEFVGECLEDVCECASQGQPPVCWPSGDRVVGTQETVAASRDLSSEDRDPGDFEVRPVERARRLKAPKNQRRHQARSNLPNKHL